MSERRDEGGRDMDAAEAHRHLMIATGGSSGTLGSIAHGLGSIAHTVGEVATTLEDLVEALCVLLAVVDETVDDQGREIWLTATEAELDSWLGRLVDSRDTARRMLSPKTGE